MQLTMSSSASALGRSLLTVARVAGVSVSTSVVSPAVTSLLTPAGATYTAPAVIAKALAAAKPALLGRSASAEAAVTQWCDFAADEAAATSAAGLATLNSWLVRNSYLAGASFTLADAFVFSTVAPAVSTLPAAKAAALPALVRWVRQVLNEPGFELSKLAADVPAIALPEAPAFNPAAHIAAFTAKVSAAPVVAAGAAPVAAAPVAAAPAVAAAPVAAVPASASTPAAAPSAAAAGAGEAAAAPAAAGKKDAKEAKKAKAKDAAAAAPVAEPAAAVEPVAMCDFRVGCIVKVWPHPSAERLFCEEIDVGEEKPRQIASGLREHYTLEQMEGRRVVVVCNLKPRALVGFDSNGMVLAATSAEGKVELLDPPAGAKVGERVFFEGHVAEAATPNVMTKKKIFDAAAEGLRVDAQLRATYKGVPMSTSAGAVTVPSVAGGTIH